MCFALLDAIAAGGGTTFDTAHVYGIGGAGENGLGLWLAERGNRNELVIIGMGGIRPEPPAPYKVMPSFIDADLFESLAHLQTGYVDLYMMHYDDPAAPIGPLMETLNAHRAAGRTRAIGCSNMTHERFEEANEYADKHGIEPFGGPRTAVFAGGTGCHLHPRLGEHLRAGSPRRARLRLPANFERLERAAALAERRGASIAQIALAFLLTGPLNVFALTGPRSPAEFADSAGALEIALTPAERAWLDLETDAAT